MPRNILKTGKQPSTSIGTHFRHSMQGSIFFSKIFTKQMVKYYASKNPKIFFFTKYFVKEYASLHVVRPDLTCLELPRKMTIPFPFDFYPFEPY